MVPSGTQETISKKTRCKIDTESEKRYKKKLHGHQEAFFSFSELAISTNNTIQCSWNQQNYCKEKVQDTYSSLVSCIRYNGRNTMRMKTRFYWIKLCILRTRNIILQSLYCLSRYLKSLHMLKRHNDILQFQDIMHIFQKVKFCNSL